MCDQAYAQSDQSLCSSLEYSVIVKLLTEHHLDIHSTLNWPIVKSEKLKIEYFRFDM